MHHAAAVYRLQRLDQAASSGHRAASGSGPCSLTTWSRDGPGTKAVASHGGCSSSPLATTGAV